MLQASILGLALDCLINPWMSGYFGDPERVEIWPAQTHLPPTGCFEIALIRMLDACDLLSAQRTKKNASVIVDYKVDQAARKQGLSLSWRGCRQLHGAIARGVSAEINNPTANGADHEGGERC